MTTFYTVAARLSGIAAVVCAALALLTSPAVSRADPLSDCYDACVAAHGAGTPDFITCTGFCQGGGGVKCVGKTCDEGGNKCSGSHPHCSKSSVGCRRFTTSDCALCRCLDNKALIPDCECL